MDSFDILMVWIVQELELWFTVEKKDQWIVYYGLDIDFIGLWCYYGLKRKKNNTDAARTCAHTGARAHAHARACRRDFMRRQKNLCDIRRMTHQPYATSVDVRITLY